MRFINYFYFILLLFSCNDKAKNTEFDKSKWLMKDDVNSYPYREAMLNDLISNYKLKGLSYKQLTDIIGVPAPGDISDYKLYYPISEEYGMDIDPVYAKTLVIEFSKDSIVTGYRIDEYKK